MIWLLLGGAVWLLMAGIGAVVLGKSIRRADEMQERDVW